ncbi:hypothetical protein JG688_00014500 [Phytophthora aleatoria]|uniref:Uncharacterized protein n=1 Tax=Phytophthora aleatoria TaxID=2496075 RepID=A0A8J5IJP1_9STRA|nr:hypothetical protein JG688_00014500 [Phytophthora aleatoria]
MLKHINAMNRWHTCMEYLSQTENAINWAVNASIKRITIPDQLSNGVSGLTTIVWGTGLRYCNVNTLILESSTLYSCVSSFENSSSRLSKPVIPLWKKT